nr:unnamed protein product [Digitaria exilis]
MHLVEALGPGHGDAVAARRRDEAGGRLATRGTVALAVVVHLAAEAGAAARGRRSTSEAAHGGTAASPGRATGSGPPRRGVKTRARKTTTARRKTAETTSRNDHCQPPERAPPRRCGGRELRSPMGFPCACARDSSTDEEPLPASSTMVGHRSKNKV